MSSVPRGKETRSSERTPSEDHRKNCMNKAEFRLGPKALSRVETVVMVGGKHIVGRGLGH